MASLCLPFKKKKKHTHTHKEAKHPKGGPAPRLQLQRGDAAQQPQRRSPGARSVGGAGGAGGEGGVAGDGVRQAEAVPGIRFFDSMRLGPPPKCVACPLWLSPSPPVLARVS